MAKCAGQYTLNKGEVERRGRATTAGHVFRGGCDAKGQRHGQGVERFPQGGVYKGEYRGNQRHGRGELLLHDGAHRYVGQFVRGRFHGHGTLTTPAATLEGQWRDGRLHGRGIITLREGSVFEGEFAAGKRDGRCVCHFASGMAYSGEWQEGKRHGYGEQDWPGGLGYRGAWREDRPDGMGVMTYPSGHAEQGRWAGGALAQACDLAEVEAALGELQMQAEAAAAAREAAAVQVAAQDAAERQAEADADAEDLAAAGLLAPEDGTLSSLSTAAPTPMTPAPAAGRRSARPATAAV